MDRQTLFLNGDDKGAVRCGLCHHACLIPNGCFGSCGVRGNKNGRGFIPFYGHITAFALDPVEKKPLYHFRPGTMILSAGFAGCNFRCPFCQNWGISQASGKDIPGRQMPPGDIVREALKQESSAIAYTYSEPLVHIEYLLDCMNLARKHGIANVIITNGCVNTDAAGEILSLTDAANIDLKCFSPGTYEKNLCGNLETVLAFIRLAVKKGVHVETTTLVVPDLNDSLDELDGIANFLVSLNSELKTQNPPAPEVPWHLSAYRPEYRWNAPPTDPEFLIRLKKRAAGKLRYVYTGNISIGDNNTVCPGCGTVLVRRFGYRVKIEGLSNLVEGENVFRCIRCGEKTDIVG